VTWACNRRFPGNVQCRGAGPAGGLGFATGLPSRCIVQVGHWPRCVTMMNLVLWPALDHKMGAAIRGGRRIDEAQRDCIDATWNMLVLILHAPLREPPMIMVDTAWTS
jgi:hypothetical protein